MSGEHQMPDDTSRDPERAVDAMEEDIFGTTMDQERDDDPDPDHADPDDGTTGPPTPTESPA